MNNYRQTSSSACLKSTGMWTLIAIAISACCVAVATSRRQTVGQDKTGRERKIILKPFPRSQPIEAPQRSFRQLVRQILRFVKFPLEAARPNWTIQPVRSSDNRTHPFLRERDPARSVG